MAVDEHQRMISYGGSLTQDANGAASRAFTAQQSAPVRMISYGGSAQ